jgi:hypothetical protein
MIREPNREIKGEIEINREINGEIDREKQTQ